MNIQFDKKLIASLILAALICAGITGFFFHYSNTIKTTSNLVSHSQEEVEQLKKLFSLMQDCETGTRGFVITKDDKFLEPYIKAVDSLPKVLNRLNVLFKDDRSQQKNSVSLSFFINKKIQNSQLSITTRREKDFNTAMELMAEGTGKRTMDTIRILVARMLAHENNVLQQRKTANQKEVSHNNTILLAIIVFFVMVLFLLTGNLLKYLKEKRTTEQRLKESNDRFNFVSKATADAIWDCDLKTGKVLWENNFEILFGHKLKNLDPNISSWEKFIHLEDKERVINRLNKLKNSKENNWKDEYKFLKADGTYAYILDKAVIIRDMAGEACRMIGSMRDITERKEAEMKIQQSEAKYRQIVETAQEGIWMVDKIDTTVFVNKKMCNMLGYSFEEFIGKKRIDFMDEEGIALVLQNEVKSIAGVDEHSEMKFITKTGESIWTSVAITDNIDNEDNSIGGMAMFTDITNRKKAEEQLKSSEEGLRLLIDNLKDYAIYSINTEGNILTWNNGAKKMKGYDASEVIGKHISIFYNEDDRRNNLAQIHLKEAVQNGSHEIDGLHVRKDGNLFWANSVFTAIYNDSGKLYGFAKITRDVTDKKQAEQELQKVSERLSLATSTSNIGIWELNLINNKTTMDETSWKLFGLTSHEPMEVEEVMQRYIHPQDLPKMQQALADSISNKSNLNIEYRVVWPDHSVHYLVSSGTVKLDDSGRVTGLLGTNLDLTERRKSEAQLIESERNLNAILKSTQGALYLLDLDFKLVLINESARDLIGKMAGRECKLGEAFINYFDQEIQAGLQKAFSNVLQGNPFEVERELHAEGKIFFYHSTYFPVRDDYGNITNICCSSKDITEKKITEEIIHAANAEKEEYQYRFQSILDNSPQPILIKNLDGTYSFTNKTFKDAFGINQKDIIGKKSKDIFQNMDSVEKFDASDNEVLTKRIIKEEEHKITLSTGECKDIQLIKFPLFDRKKQLFGLGTIGKDITEIKRYEYELIGAREKAEKAERLQEEFLANMSHELRTPMNGIIGMANVLSYTALLPEQQKQIKIIQQSSDTLLNLINDILDLSKIKAGMLNIESLDFDFTETIANTTRAFKEKTREKGIRFTVQTEPFIPKLLIGDSHRLTQILNNLLSNAIKFTEKGYVKLEAVLVSEKDEDALIEFIISDSGIGIEQCNVEAIFRSFEQASGDIARKYGGTGLGLPITKRLIELQGGEISVESTLGIGSVFTFTLPYKISRNAPAVDRSKNIKKTISAVKKDYSGKQILIAEDNEINQDVLAATLKQYNLSYTIANNGKEAIEQLESGKHFDLVFMDLRMPVMNGFQATAYIREKLGSAIPIVILTASVLRNEREKCLAIGASDYMAKPFNHARLNECLEKYLESNESDKIEETDVTLIESFDNTYNLTNLLELQDEESIQHILQLFLKNIPQQLDELNCLVDQKNSEEFLEKIHKFKGSLSIIQIPKIYELILLAESTAIDKKDWDSITEILTEVSAIYTKLVPAIRKEVEAQFS